MKKLLTVVLFAALGFAGVVLAEDEIANDGAYFGAGFIKLQSDSFPLTWTETNRILHNGATRDDRLSRIASNILLGYKFSNGLSIEVGRTFDDPGASAETNGVWTGYDAHGDLIHIPLLVRHTEKYSAWQLATLGEYKVGDSLALIGKVGLNYSTTKYERLTSYVCIPACATYNEKSSEKSQTDFTYGIGVKAKVMNRTRGDVWASMTVEKLPNKLISSRVSLLFPF